MRRLLAFLLLLVVGRTRSIYLTWYNAADDLNSVDFPAFHLGRETTKCHNEQCIEDTIRRSTTRTVFILYFLQHTHSEYMSEDTSLISYLHSSWISHLFSFSSYNIRTVFIDCRERDREGCINCV